MSYKQEVARHYLMVILAFAAMTMKNKRCFLRRLLITAWTNAVIKSFYPCLRLERNNPCAFMEELGKIMNEG
jgi:hypothetical protein